MKLYIIIVNYKKYRETNVCLHSIFRCLPKIFTENIILIDNESNEEIEGVEEIRKKYPKLLIIKSKTNLGFAKSINLGIGEALKKRATHVLILNNDTVVSSDFLTPLINSKYDLVSPIIKFKRKGEWTYDFGGKVNWLIGRPYHLERKKIFNFSRQKRDPAMAGQFSIFKNKLDYVSGCSLMVKKDVFEKIGLFDENFFLYFEDVDFCLRAKKAGFRVGVETKSIITHFLEEEKNQTRLFKLKYLLQSQKYFIDKWIPFYFRPLALGYYWWLKLKMND